MEDTMHSQGSFVQRDFRKNEKLRREKQREDVFSRCLAGREGEKKKLWGMNIFSQNLPKCLGEKTT